MNFIITDQQDYKVEGVLGPEDFVLPLNSQIQSMNSLIKLSQSKKWKEIQQQKKKDSENLQNKAKPHHRTSKAETLGIPRITSNFNEVGGVQNKHLSTTPARGTTTYDQEQQLANKKNLEHDDNELPNN
jgi:sortase (surface protein transpeptidase)